MSSITQRTRRLHILYIYCTHFIRTAATVAGVINNVNDDWPDWRLLDDMRIRQPGILCDWSGRLDILDIRLAPTLSTFKKTCSRHIFLTFLLH